MKLIRYILLTLLLPVFPAGAQNLCGSRVQVANPSILIGDNGRVMWRRPLKGGTPWQICGISFRIRCRNR